MNSFKRVVIYDSKLGKRTHEIAVHMWDGSTYRFGRDHMLAKMEKYGLSVEFLGEVSEVTHREVRRLSPGLPEGHEEMTDEAIAQNLNERRVAAYERAQLLLIEFEEALETYSSNHT